MITTTPCPRKNAPPDLARRRVYSALRLLLRYSYAAGIPALADTARTAMCEVERLAIADAAAAEKTPPRPEP